MEKYYTIQQVADKLQVHQLTVRRWIKEGKIKIKRFSERNIRITESELNRFIEKGAVDNG